MDYIFDYLLAAILKGAGSIIEIISDNTLGFFTLPIVINVLDLFEYVGGALLVCGLLFGITKHAIEAQEDGGTEWHQLILNIFYSILALAFIRAGVIFLFTLSKAVQKSLFTTIDASNYETVFNKMQTSLATGVAPSATPGSAGLSSLWIIVIVVMLIVMLLIIFFQMLKRTGIILAHIAIGYLHVFSLPSGNFNDFFSWCKMAVAICATNIIQTTLLLIGMSLITVDTSIQRIFLGMGVLLAATEVEKVCERFGFSTGTRRQLGSAVNSVNSSVKLYRNVSGIVK